MHVPLSIRLIALLALAWRLIILAKKPNPLSPKVSVDLNNIPKCTAVYLSDAIASKESLKQLYRDKIRGYEMDSQENMLAYIFTLLEKEYRQKGIFRFLWFKPTYTLALYQALKLIEYQEALVLFSNILKVINPIAFQNIENEEIDINSDDFIPDGQMDKEVFETFDRIFDLEIFAQKISTYVCTPA